VSGPRSPRHLSFFFFSSEFINSNNVKWSLLLPTSPSATNLNSARSADHCPKYLAPNAATRNASVQSLCDSEIHLYSVDLKGRVLRSIREYPPMTPDDWHIRCLTRDRLDMLSETGLLRHHCADSNVTSHKLVCSWSGIRNNSCNYKGVKVSAVYPHTLSGIYSLPLFITIMSNRHPGDGQRVLLPFWFVQLRGKPVNIQWNVRCN